MTTAQARALIASALQDDEAHLADTLARVEYQQRRNHAAYCSHRQTTLKRYHDRMPTHRKRKVSK